MDLLHLDYPLDIDRLLMEAESVRHKSIPYQVTSTNAVNEKYFGHSFDQWTMAKYNSPYIQKIMDDFEVEGKPRFYFQEPFFELPPHVDHNTTCSINFVLSDNIAPVDFSGRQYYYKQALLNTSNLHSVRNGSEERILLKISLFDISFEQLVKTIKYASLTQRYE